MKYSIIFLVLLSIINIKCQSPTSPENNSPILNGKVIDVQGNPLKDVDVHYIFSVPSHLFAKSQNLKSLIRISFTVNIRSFVSVTLCRYFSNDSMKSVVNDTLEAGMYSYWVDMSKFTNGVYVYRLNIGAEKTEKYLFYLNPDLSTLLQTVPLTKTNSNGIFSIPIDLFGFNVPLIRTNEQGNILDTTTISKSIQLVLNKIGYNVLIQPVTIESKKEINLSFTLISH